MASYEYFSPKESDLPLIFTSDALEKTINEFLCAILCFVDTNWIEKNKTKKIHPSFGHLC